MIWQSLLLFWLIFTLICDFHWITKWQRCAEDPFLVITGGPAGLFFLISWQMLTKLLEF